VKSTGGAKDFTCGKGGMGNEGSSPEGRERTGRLKQQKGNGVQWNLFRIKSGRVWKRAIVRMNQLIGEEEGGGRGGWGGGSSC